MAPPDPSADLRLNYNFGLAVHVGRLFHDGQLKGRADARRGEM